MNALKGLIPNQGAVLCVEAVWGSTTRFTKCPGIMSLQTGLECGLAKV